MLRLTFLVCVLVSLSATILVRENVVFQKVKQITTVRAKWMVTFVADLIPFENFLVRTQYNVDMAIIAAAKFQAIVNKFSPEKKNWVNIALGVRKEMINLNQTCADITTKFKDLKSMYYDKPQKNKFRLKRGLIPIVGKALSFLFGTVSEDDLNSIRSNIRTLSMSQNKIIHVVKEEMTILNITRGRVSENRQKINGIIDTVHELSDKLVSVTTTVGVLQTYLHGYNQLGLVISEIEDMLSIAGDYLSQLQLKLNMLSMGHLSPSVITPNDLRQLLGDIKSKLPKTLQLPKDENKEIWQYYKFLTCSTILEKNRILVILNIPLMALNENFDIYKVHNLPAPAHKLANASSSTAMVAHFELETKYFAVNKDKTKYSLLDEEEIGKCANPLIDFCELKKPILPINLSQLCVITLFNNKAWKTTCSTIVKPNTRLPLASYISDGIWVIASLNKFRLTVTCPKGQVRDQKIIPPLVVVPLKKGCIAHSDYFTLNPTYNIKSLETVNNDDNSLLKNYQTLNITIWRSFHTITSNISKIKLPSKLESIKQISMDKLIEETQLLNVPNADFVFPNWGISVSAGVGGLLLGLAIYIFCKCKGYSCLARKDSTRLGYHTANQSYPLVTVPIAEREIEYTRGAVASAPMATESFKLPSVNYGTPFAWRRGHTQLKELSN